MYRLSWALVAWMLLVAFSAGQAAEKCEHGIYCLDVRNVPGGADVYARTLQGDEITMGFTLRLENARSSGGNVVTQILTSKRLVRLFSVRQIDPAKGWGWWYQYEWRFGQPGGNHQDGYLYELPWGAGQTYHINQGFFGKFSHMTAHALDIGMPIGKPVLAARAGVVVGIVDLHGEGGPNAPPYKENLVAVRHDDGSTAVYYHLLKGGMKVRRGQRVQVGQPIALSGNSGRSTTPHLHLEVFVLRPGAKRVTVPFHFRLDNSGNGYELKQGQDYTPPGAGVEAVEDGIRVIEEK